MRGSYHVGQTEELNVAGACSPSTNHVGHVHRLHTHSVHDVHTVCSQARTNVNACLWLKMVELYHLCAPKKIHLQVSHVTPMLVVPAPSHFQSTTARSTTWTARSSPRPHCTLTTLLQEPLQPLPEKLLHEPLPANAIRSENNAKESLSDPEYESAGNLRNNTPTGYHVNASTEDLPHKSLAKHSRVIPMKKSLRLQCQCTMEQIESRKTVGARSS